MDNKKSKPQSPEPQSGVKTEIVDIRFQIISTDLLDDPEQPIRTEMTPASVEDLILSIKQVGLIEPLVVKPVNGRFEVIAGHRRLYASKLAKIVELPCYVRKANNEQTEMLKIHENMYRENIKPADEAKHFAYLIKEHKMTPQGIANLISKSASYVSDRMAILEYPDFLLEAMNNGEISFSVAREFARFEDLKQMSSAVYYAKRSGMTQEMARKWVMDFKREKERNTIQPVTPINGQGEDQPVEHTTNCIYCGEPLKLMEAEVVYMHTKCRGIAETPQPETPKPTTN